MRPNKKVRCNILLTTKNKFDIRRLSVNVIWVLPY